MRRARDMRRMVRLRSRLPAHFVFGVRAVAVKKGRNNSGRTSTPMCAFIYVELV